MANEVMKNAFLLFLVIFGIYIPDLKATHKAGGNLSYECISGSGYKFNAILYKDCSGAAFPATFAITLNPIGPGPNIIFSMFRIAASNIPVITTNPCYSATGNICIQEHIYVSDTISIPSSLQGYDVYYSDAKLAAGITSINASSTIGESLIIRIPDPGMYPCNNSPVFNNVPKLIACLNDPFSLDYSAMDPDGDSLSYSLCDIFQDVPISPPFQIVPYLNPYSGSYPISSNPAIAIDPLTGIVTGTGDIAGKWMIKICVGEYRNGIIIGDYSTEIIFYTDNCNSSSYPVVDAGIDTGICLGNTYQLNGMSSLTNSKIRWSPGNTLSDSTILNPIAFPSSTTEYILNVTDSVFGCFNKDTVSIIVDSFNNLFASPDVSICYNTSTSIYATGSAVYEWDTIPGLNCYICQAPVASPSLTTLYKVTGINQSGCIKEDSVLVTVYDPVPLNAGSDTLICYGDTAFLLASGANIYIWDPDPALSCFGCPDPKAYPLITRNFKVTGIDSIGCKETDIVRVNVLDQILMDAGPDSIICLNDSLFLEGVVLNTNIAYNWSPSTFLSDSMVLNPLAVPDHSINYVLTAVDTVFGCSNSDAVMITVDSFLLFSASVDTLICHGSEVQLNASGALVYSWSPITGLDCTLCPDPIANPDSSMVYYVTGINENGCRDMDTVFVDVHPRIEVSAGIDETYCPGDSLLLQGSSNHISSIYNWSPSQTLSNNQILTPWAFPIQTTNYVLTVTDTITQCINRDSVLITINAISGSTINPVACISYTVPSGNHIHTTSGTYMDTLTNSDGCDSILTINLTIKPFLSDTIFPMACDSYTVPSGSNSYTVTGNYKDTLTSVTGCDSIITIHLTVNQASSAIISPVACNIYTVPSGDETYMVSGTYMDTIPNANGCDSVITINLNIVNSTSSIINPSTCGSYTVPSGNQTYTVSGIYNDTILNSAGCDSILTINLTILASSSSFIQDTACNSYVSPSGQHIWGSSGIYSDTLINSLGCDSVLTIDLIVNYNDTGSMNPTVCDSFISPSGNLYYVSGTYSDTILTNGGCDSIITISLTIVSVDTSVIVNHTQLTANAAGANYQWIDCISGNHIPGDTNQSFMATVNGNYAVIINQGGCVDTSRCIDINTVGIKKPPLKPELSVFPNPGNGYIYLEIESTTYQGKITTGLYNMLGNKLLEWSVNMEYIYKTHLDVSKYPKGQYLLSVKLNNTIIVRKLGIVE